MLALEMLSPIAVTETAEVISGSGGGGEGVGMGSCMYVCMYVCMYFWKRDENICKPSAGTVVGRNPHRGAYTGQDVATCAPAPPFQCCFLKPCVPVQDVSHSTSLLW